MDKATSIDEWLDMTDSTVDAECAYALGLNARIRCAMCDELGAAGMSVTYRDRFVAYAPIAVLVELTFEQERRLLGIVRKAVRNTYNVYSKLGFNDDAIAILGSHFRVEGV